MLKPCASWNTRLSAYLDGEGNVNERRAVEAHLAECAACRAAAEILRCDAQDVAAALAPRGAADGFADRVLAQVAVTTMEGPAPKPAPTKPAPNGNPVGVWVQILATLCVVAVVGVIIFPVFAKPREKSRQSTCINNVRQLIVAIQVTMQDNGNLFPGREIWGSYPFPPEALIDPTADAQEGNSYGYNINLSGKKVNDPGLPEPQYILVIADCKRPDNMIHGPDDVDFRHGGRAVVGFADGHVALETPERVAALLAGSRHPTIAPPERNYGLAEKLQIAYRAEMALQSADVRGSLERAELLFGEYEGFVLSSEYRTIGDGMATATVSGRVPSAKLGRFLVEMDGLGTLVSRTVNGEDLTGTHLAQVEKLGDLAETQHNLRAIEHRAKPNEALKAESSRAGAATEASSARAEQYAIKSRVVLADVTVQIGSLPAPATPADPVKDAASRAFGGLRAFGTWLFTGVLIPLGIWLPVWAPLAWLGVVLKRRYFPR